MSNNIPVPALILRNKTSYDSAKKAGIILTDISERKEQINVDKGVVLQIGTKCHEDYVGELKVGNTMITHNINRFLDAFSRD